ncbi:hypothetical protein OPQ81_009494 [Rhizoctonia solani]|nr:hypothetical protein OPQ81_009494 [Rhizoctonia solani]
MEPDFDDIPSELMQNAAQASRLRRRGAIRSGGRIDLFPSSSHHLGRENPDCLLVNSLRAANDRRGVRRVICGGAEESFHRPGASARTVHQPSSTTRVPRMRSCAALIDPDDEDAAIGGLPEHTYPVPKSKTMCKCTRERVGCLRCGNEVGVRYRACAMHAFRVDRANTLFDPTHTHLDEPFSETEVMHVDADGNDSDSDSAISVGGTTGTGLHSVINTLSSLLGQQRRQPLRSPPPVPTPLRTGLSPMLALSELPWVQESNALPATGTTVMSLAPHWMLTWPSRILGGGLRCQREELDGNAVNLLNGNLLKTEKCPKF